MRLKSTILLIAFGALALGGPGTGLALEATPAADSGEAIDPAECQIEPRSTDDLIDLWFDQDEAGTPVAASPVVAQAMTSIPVPLGERADATTIAGVNATMRELLACSNAGDIARYLALFSDTLALQFLPEPDETPDDVRMFLEAKPEPVPVEQRSRLLAVTNVAVMDDGRVAALVTTIEAENPSGGPETVLALFVEGDGRWLADEVVVLIAYD